MATLMERASAMLARGMIAANSETGVPVVITVTRRGTAAQPLSGWFGRGLQFNDAETGLRVVVSEREFFFKVADMTTATLGEPRTGDRYQVSGETDIFEVMDPSNLNEPAWRHSDNDRTIYRVHTKRVKVA
jgi:hypothetical protein